MARYRNWLATALLCCTAIGSALAGGGSAVLGGDTEFLDPTEVFRPGKPLQNGDTMVLEGKIADGYYVYRHSLKLVDGQGNAVTLNLPAGQKKHDEFFGETEIYKGSVARLRFSASVAGPITLHWQGCAEAGICYPPQAVKIVLLEAAAPQATSVPDKGLDASISGDSSTDRYLSLAHTTPPVDAITGLVATKTEVAEDQSAAQRLATLGPVSGTLLFFGFGLLLAFTPCTLPMIPIVSTMVVGTQASPRRAFALTLSYVLAMAATYSMVGVAAGLAGANLQATLQSPWLLGSFSILFLILASSLFGLFELQLPSALVNRLESSGRGRPGGNIYGAAIMGFLSALLVGPCMTAPLAGALLYISQTGSALYGGVVLLALGLGMGLPLLAIAVFGARILPKPGAWMDKVRVAFGYAMLGMAVMMLGRFLPGSLTLALWAAWALSLAFGLFVWAQALLVKNRMAWSLRFGAALLSLWSTLMLVGAASGADSPIQPLARLQAPAESKARDPIAYVHAKTVNDLDMLLATAGNQGRWTLIDYYADWCISCHVIERNVFGDPAVRERLNGMQVIRLDVTNNDTDSQMLLRRWGAAGPPTLIFVGPDGAERREARVVGEINASEFMKRLNMTQPLPTGSVPGDGPASRSHINSPLLKYPQLTTL
ncbi:MAG: protein-disulfide reductase DsbD [Rhodocyclaceae bacterium]|nr:protein-disulfide reductase DsbD [Rhodocyclaceae bacterium]